MTVTGQLERDVEFALAVVVVDADVIEDGDGVVGALLEARGPKTNLDTCSLEKRLWWSSLSGALRHQ